jgi:hypothetical protein
MSTARISHDQTMPTWKPASLKRGMDLSNIVILLPGDWRGRGVRAGTPYSATGTAPAAYCNDRAYPRTRWSAEP